METVLLAVPLCDVIVEGGGTGHGADLKTVGFVPAEQPLFYLDSDLLSVANKGNYVKRFLVSFWKRTCFRDPAL